MTPNVKFGRFSRSSRVEFLADGRSVRIVREFSFIRPDGGWIKVPRGFVCDGASIPRILWPLSGGPFEGKHRDAALVHDALYASHRCAKHTGDQFDRATADRVFYEAMRAGGVDAIRATCKYLAVRMFGGRAWNAK